jgi:hypothetical protein
MSHVIVKHDLIMVASPTVVTAVSRKRYCLELDEFQARVLMQVCGDIGGGGIGREFMSNLFHNFNDVLDHLPDLVDIDYRHDILKFPVMTDRSQTAEYQSGYTAGAVDGTNGYKTGRCPFLTVEQEEEWAIGYDKGYKEYAN